MTLLSWLLLFWISVGMVPVLLYCCSAVRLFPCFAASGDRRKSLVNHEQTYRHLWREITSFENLLLAFKKAARGKRSKPGVGAWNFLP